MPSFDINAILSAALATAVAEAVAEAVAPLVERIAALENNPAQGVDSTLERRVAALETEPSDLIAAIGDDFKTDLITHLNNQGWFWEKLTHKAREVAEAVAARAVEQHCEEYDHDNYDEIASKVDDMPDFDDLVTKDYLSESVRDAVQDLSFEIRVS